MALAVAPGMDSNLNFPGSTISLGSSSLSSVNPGNNTDRSLQYDYQYLPTVTTLDVQYIIVLQAGTGV